jgi:hypothetical protein
MDILKTGQKAQSLKSPLWLRNMKFLKVVNFEIALIIALFLGVIPTFWLGKLYFVGGDNSQLYYLMPREMMNDYLFNIVSDNSLGTLGAAGQQSYQAPFFGILYFLKCTLPAATNIQALTFGINLAFSFLGFYWLIGLWISGDNASERLVRAIGGVAYCTSLFIVSAMWKHALYSLYLTSMFPVVLYLFLKGVRQQSLHYLVSAALLATLFSVVLMAVPWLVGAILIILPLLIWHQIEHRNTFRYFVYFVGILVALNIFWLDNMVLTLLAPDNVYDTISSPASNDYTIRSVTGGNNIAYPLLGDSMPRWIVEIERVWLGPLPTTAVYSLLIIAAGIFSGRPNQLFGVYHAAMLCWIVGIYFYTVRIGGWGIDFFIILNHSVPGFTMFRNNFDKFSIGIAFSFAFLVAISLSILINQPFLQVNAIARRTFLGALSVLVIWQAFPFFSNSSYNSPLWTTKSTYTTISRFNDDFNALVAYLKQESGDIKYLWLPLNNAGYIQIADAQLPQHYYNGTSPLRFLADKSDYTGRFSFGSQAVGDKLFNKIIDHDFDGVVTSLKVMNIGYVIVNNDLSPDIINSYLYGIDSPGDLYNIQMNSLKNFILGEHVRDFGSRYSLYKIKPDLNLNKIDVTESASGRGKVIWKKISSSQYALNLDGLDGLAQLVFLEPFHREWELTTTSGKKLSPAVAQHTRVYGYANSWQLNSESLVALLPPSDYSRAPDGSLSIEVKLEFAPARWTPYGFWVSGIAFAIGLLYLAMGFKGRRREA